ncbi:MAG: superoxide dismutase [Bacteroidales bacterium]|nr:superoxide dismutase [Bacteroidales bacterium]
MKTTLFTLIGLLLLTNVLVAQFTQKPLPYSYNALEPYIDAQTMEIHYSKHHAGYINNLNKALQETGQENSNNLIAILNNISNYNTAIRNNAGGHYNHELFWNLLTPEKTKPSDNLLKVIEKEFGSFDEFKNHFNKEAASRFGSGWAWLIVTEGNKLAITSTPNQDNPLMDISTVKGIPILGIDVWEHAYYLKYQNRRPEYLQAIWNIINWEEVEKNYKNALTK